MQYVSMMMMMMIMMMVMVMMVIIILIILFWFLETGSLHVVLHDLTFTLYIRPVSNPEIHLPRSPNPEIKEVCHHTRMSLLMLLLPIFLSTL